MTETKPVPNERDRQLLRRTWWMIYLPLIVGSLLALALVLAIAIPGFRSANLAGDPASVWGDAAAILVILEAGFGCLFALILLIALCAALFWVYPELQPLLRRGQALTLLLSQSADRWANKLAEPLIRAHFWSARVRAIKGFFWR